MKVRKTQKTMATKAQEKKSTTSSQLLEQKLITSMECSQKAEYMSQSRGSYAQLRRKNAKYKKQHVFELLRRISMRRKRYAFQVIKQFFLFPDQTFSDNLSFDNLDYLYITDEPLHTIVKIYETKQLQLVIWAFINLKALRLKKKLQQFSSEVTNIQQRVKIRNQKIGFGQIKTYSIKIRPNVQKKPIKSKFTLVSNQIHQTISLKKQIAPEVVRIKSESPQISRVKVSPSRTRVIYPQMIRSQVKRVQPIKTQVRRVSREPTPIETRTISPIYRYPAYYPYGGTCIHIHGCCSIHCCHCCENNLRCSNVVYHPRQQDVREQKVSEEYNPSERIHYIKQLQQTVKRKRRF